MVVPPPGKSAAILGLHKRSADFVFVTLRRHRGVGESYVPDTEVRALPRRVLCLKIRHFDHGSSADILIRRSHISNASAALARFC